jgi:hypothetical protein
MRSTSAKFPVRLIGSLLMFDVTVARTVGQRSTIRWVLSL